MANIEDRQKNLEKRLSYNKVVVGILAFCLMLAVAAHLDAQPKPRGLGTRPGSQQIDSRRLNQILAKIEQRLTSLEKQSVSHQPSSPAMHQPGSSFGQASIEKRLTALEKQISQARVTRTSQLPAVPTSNQAASSPDLTTIKARVTALEQKVSQRTAAPAANQMSSNTDLSTIEARLAALENQTGSPQQAAPATEQTGSAVGELTCTKLTVVNSQGQPIFEVMDHSTGGQALLYAPDGDPRIIMRVSPHHGGAHVNLYGGSGLSAGISLDAGRTGTGSTVSVFDPSAATYMKYLAPESHTH